MKRAISNFMTRVLAKLPASMHGIILRKAIAISSEEVKFHNRQMTMFGSIANLRDSGFLPTSIIDVGANIGDWSRSAGDIFPQACVYMIEAQEELTSELAAAARSLGARASYEIALLGAKDAESVVFYELGTGSSVLEETTLIEKNVRKLPMKRLDDLDLLKGAEGPFLLKLDVQGYELEILKAADKVLADTEVVLLEVALLPYNKDAPLMAEVVAFMDDRGFAPYDICSQMRRVSDKALFQADVIFVRKESQLRAHRRYSMFEPEYSDQLR